MGSGFKQLKCVTLKNLFLQDLENLSLQEFGKHGEKKSVENIKYKHTWLMKFMSCRLLEAQKRSTGNTTVFLLCLRDLLLAKAGDR